MPKRKKSSRRPASSRPQDDQFTTTTMPHDNPNSITQTSISIDDDDDDDQIHQNPNPKPTQHPNLAPQSVIPAAPDDDEQAQVQVEDKPHKRKQDSDHESDPEKKLKHDEAIDQEDVKSQSPTTLCLEDEDDHDNKVEGTAQDTPRPHNHLTGTDLEGAQVKEATEQHQQKQPKDDQPAAPSSSRKTPKRKKPKMNVKQRAAFEKKLSIAKQNLKPIPFVPQKKLNFSEHEQLFRRLGLWDFVNMEFDQDIRSDLLALLIVNYNQTGHYSIVNDVRIKLTRADLARALKLPVKKDKSITLETSDFDSEVLSEKAISFMGEFLSYWILLHEEMWILPAEVLNWDSLVRKGEPHKVDWPRFIWYMVEKELKHAPKIGTLYFASHIQCLMKSQRDDLFKEKPLPDIPVEVEEDSEWKTGCLKDYEELELKNQKTELCLGQNESKEHFEQGDTMDYQEGQQEPGVQAQWSLDDKSYMGNHFLQRCSLSDAQNQQSQHEIEEVEDEEYDTQPKCSTLGGLASTDPFQGNGTTSVTCNPSYVSGHSSGDLFQSGVDANLNPGGMSMLIDSFNREVNPNDMQYHHDLNGNHNQGHMSSDELPQDFNFCIDQIQCLADKAKAMYEEKERIILNAKMNQQLISDLQHQNGTLMNYIQNTEFELHRREIQNCKLEREIHVMANLLEDYRNALKETRRAFSEYRERNPEAEEPLYKDAGPGGLVLSTMELEKQRMEREEEERMKLCVAKQVTADFEAKLLEKYEGYKYSVHQLEKRLLELEGKIELYKALCSKPKMDVTK